MSAFLVGYAFGVATPFVLGTFVLRRREKLPAVGRVGRACVPTTFTSDQVTAVWRRGGEH